MPQSQPRKWSTISREERFFTSTLFHDIPADPVPMLDDVVSKLALPAQTELLDVGYEVCFFRDAALACLIEWHCALEKQTFDLMLVLSEGRIVIVEAKAQQGFHVEQMEKLKEARALMVASSKWTAKDVRLLALTSSRYSPGPKTRATFDAFCTWRAVARMYPGNAAIYERADSIYGDRR